MKSDKKFIEVLSEVVKELIGPHSNDVKKAEKKVVETLIKKGYKVNEISDVLEEIFQTINIQYEKEFKLRVIQPSEINNLTDDAKDYLFKIRGEGLLDEESFEDLITEFNSTLLRVDLSEIKFRLKSYGIVTENIIN